MKKLLLSFIALMMAGSALAQNWCPPGARWHFKRGAPYANSGVDGLVEMIPTNTTTLLNTTCTRLEANFYGTLNGLASPTVTQLFGVYYTYENNNVIFLYNNTTNVFDTVVNFNALPGDKWLRPGDPGGLNGCHPRKPMQVTDTGHVTINGFYLKTISTKFLDTITVSNNTFPINIQDVFTERILFSTYPYYMLFPTYCLMDNVIPEVSQLQFRCYEDSSFPLYNVSTLGCSSLTGIKTYEGNRISINLYPNPASQQLTIELPQSSGYELKLGDALGRHWRLSTSTINNTQLQADVSQLDQGIYFIQVYQKGQPVAIEKLVKN